MVETCSGKLSKFDVSGGGALFLHVPLAGFDLEKTGVGSLHLEPVSNVNAYDDTFVSDGNLFTGAPGTVDGRTVIPGDLHISGNAQVFRNFGNELIADTAHIFLDAGAQFKVNGGVEETIEELTANFSTVSLSGVGARFVVSGQADFANSLLRSGFGTTARFRAPFNLNKGTALADGGTLSFSDVTTTAGRFLSLNGGNTTLGGNLTVNGDPESAVIEGQFQLTQGSHDFLIAGGTAFNDLEVRALLGDGAFGPAASIVKKGAGRALFTANNTYRGTTTIAAGTLAINGQHSLNQNVVTTINNGTLAGKGLVNRINQTSGVLAPGAGVGTFTAAASAFLGDQARFVVQINGSNATQFDQLKTAALSLGAAAHPRLDVRLGFTPTVGQQFRIVDVTGTNQLPAYQVFRDLAGNVLAEGSSFLVDGLSFTITYRGGNGNDVVLTRNTPSAFQNIAITPSIVEGESVFVTGHITEPNPNDTFFLDVNWGDGSPAQTFRFAPGSPRDVRVEHRYLDDPDGANDQYRVTLRWRDQFGGTNGANLTTVVRNAAPQIVGITASLPPLKVGRPILIQGLIADRSPSDSFKVFIQWIANGQWQAVNLPSGATSFSFQHIYPRIGQHQVTVKVIDDDLDFHELKVVLNVV